MGDITAGDVAGFAETKRKYDLSKVLIAGLIRKNPEADIEYLSKELVELEESGFYPEICKKIHCRRVPGGYFSEDLSMYVGNLELQRLAESKTSGYKLTKEGIADLDSILSEAFSQNSEFVSSLLNKLGIKFKTSAIEVLE